LPASDRAPAGRDERDRLVAAVREAGAIALKFFRGPLKSWTKAGSSPVSEADIEVNHLLRERLPTLGDGWLSEESENDPTRLDARRVWVVDPIDGTRAYIAEREDWSISAALVEEGRPVLAALFAPATDELFLAAIGETSTRNGVPIGVNNDPDIAAARLAGPKKTLDRIAARHPELVVVPRIHSLALRIVRVATGEIDAAIAGGNSHDWDLAAADLLVHQAGGLISELDGRPLVYNRPEPIHGMLVAAGRARHASLLKMVRTQVHEPARS
jgi:myo-inositol-1(or 4)-monophosphatase